MKCEPILQIENNLTCVNGKAWDFETNKTFSVPEIVAGQPISLGFTSSVDRKPINNYIHDIAIQRVTSETGAGELLSKVPIAAIPDRIN